MNYSQTDSGFWVEGLCFDSVLGFLGDHVKNQMVLITHGMNVFNSECTLLRSVCKWMEYEDEKTDVIE